MIQNAVVNGKSNKQGYEGIMITGNRYSTERIGEAYSVRVVDDDPLVPAVF